MSTDTIYVHLAWKEHERALCDVAYPMASDRTGQLSRIYGVLDERTGNALRGTFIINPEGVLLNSEVNFYNLGRNIDELMRKFKANLHMARNAAEACPAQWRDSGDKTLRPSAKIVGRVQDALDEG